MKIFYVMACLVACVGLPLQAKKRYKADDGDASFVQKAADKLFEAGKEEVTALTKQVHEEASKLQDALKTQTQTIKDTVTQQSKQLADDASKAVKRMYEDTTAKVRELSEEAAQAAQHLKQQTLEALDDVVQRVEEQAAKEKYARRRQIMKSFLDEVSREEKNAWKTELLDEYQESLNYLENLINAGEKPDHAAEFIAAFKKHKQWFSSIMEQIEKSSDSRYFQLFQKNTALKNVVTAIKFIEQELQKRFSYTTDNEDFKRLRVLALYDINSLVLQKQQREKEGALESTQLSDNECLLIVALIVEQLSSGKKISDLEKSLKEHTKLLAASQEEATRQKIRAIEADKKCKELSTTLEKKVAEQDAAALVMKTTLVPKLEAATKENLSLKAIIMDKEKTIQRLQRPPAPAPVPTPAPVNPFAATAPTPPPSVLPTVALAKEEASAKRDATLSPLDTTKTIQQPVKPTAATTTITAPTAQEAERIRREAIKQDLEKRKKILLRQ